MEYESIDPVKEDPFCRFYWKILHTQKKWFTNYMKTIIDTQLEVYIFCRSITS